VKFLEYVNIQPIAIDKDGITVLSISSASYLIYSTVFPQFSTFGTHNPNNVKKTHERTISRRA
jgi:hypothetical protein